jgi:hypothetical protein
MYCRDGLGANITHEDPEFMLEVQDLMMMNDHLLTSNEHPTTTPWLLHDLELLPSTSQSSVRICTSREIHVNKRT